MEVQKSNKKPYTQQSPLLKTSSGYSIAKLLPYLISGILVAIALILGFFFLQSQKQVFDYSPSNIVYGEKVIALHNMNSLPVPETVKQSGPNGTNFPSLQVSETFYDFGSVDPEHILTHSFFIANSGSAALTIQQAFTTCGCTLAEISTDNIPAGKVALLTIQFDPSLHDMRGMTVRRGVIIYSNDPNHPTQEIWIQASVR